MFDVLIESKPKRQGIGKALPSSIFSLVTHGVLIYAAVMATMKGDDMLQEAAADTQMVFLEEQEPEPEEPEAPPPPPKGFQTLMAPVEIPTSIPPIDLTERFDPRDFTGVGVELGIATGVQQVTGPVDLTQVFIEAVVDEPPERISFPAPEYPRILLEAGVEGTVVLEAIIDTTGHAEPPSIKVVSSTNRAFEAPAKDAMRKALFRPGRVRGQPVRVLVHMPLRFVIPGRQ